MFDGFGGSGERLPSLNADADPLESANPEYLLEGGDARNPDYVVIISKTCHYQEVLTFYNINIASFDMI